MTSSLTALLDAPDGQSLIEFPFDAEIDARGQAGAIAATLGAEVKMMVIHSKGQDTVYSKKYPLGVVKKVLAK